MINFRVFMSKTFFRIRQEFLNIVFYKVVEYICKRLLLQGKFESMSIFFLFHRYLIDIVP